MATEVVRYRVCDKCLELGMEIDAEAQDRFTLNGFKFEIDLCRDHSAELYQLLMHTWGDTATATGEPSELEKQRTYAKALVQKDFPELHEDEQPEVIQLPEPKKIPIPGAQQWFWTHHAREQMALRKFTEDQVLMACARPSFTTPARSRTNAQLQYRTKGQCVAVVDPRTHTIVTVQIHGETKDTWLDSEHMTQDLVKEA